MALAGILLAPGIATILTVWDKLTLPVAPAPTPLTLTGTGALVVIRRDSGSKLDVLENAAHFPRCLDRCWKLLIELRCVPVHLSGWISFSPRS